MLAHKSVLGPAHSSGHVICHLSLARFAICHSGIRSNLDVVYLFDELFLDSYKDFSMTVWIARNVNQGKVTH